MGAWMDGWVHGWIDGCKDGSTDKSSLGFFDWLYDKAPSLLTSTVTVVPSVGKEIFTLCRPKINFAFGLLNF